MGVCLGKMEAICAGQWIDKPVLRILKLIRTTSKMITIKICHKLWLCHADRYGLLWGAIWTHTEWVWLSTMCKYTQEKKVMCFFLLEYIESHLKMYCRKKTNGFCGVSCFHVPSKEHYALSCPLYTFFEHKINACGIIWHIIIKRSWLAI